METKVTVSDVKSPVIPNRIDMVFYYDIVDGLLSGDPDAVNQARFDDDTLQSLTTDVSIKRLIRDTLRLVVPDCKLFMTTSEDKDEDRILNLKMKAAYEELKLKPNDTNAVELTKKLMCEKFIDVRTFGGVMSTGKEEQRKNEDAETDTESTEEIKEETKGKRGKANGNGAGGTGKYNSGNVTGPLQISFGRSIDAVRFGDYAITRKCVAPEKDAIKQIAEHGTITGTMGRKANIAYGLFRQKAWYSPHKALKTGFSVEDFKNVLKALVLCFGQARSASKGHISFRGVYVFQHNSPLGSAHDYELFNAIKMKKNTEFPRDFSDYDVTVGPIPESVKMTLVTHLDDVDKLQLI